VLFPEAGSSASSGKPSCGYTVAGKDDSKSYSGADAQELGTQLAGKTLEGMFQ